VFQGVGPEFKPQYPPPQKDTCFIASVKLSSATGTGLLTL
jgi:hypothetical protein